VFGQRPLQWLNLAQPVVRFDIGGICVIVPVLGLELGL